MSTGLNPPFHSLGIMSPELIIAIFSGTVSGLLFVAIQRRVGQLTPTILAIQFTFTEASFRRVLGSWGEEGVLQFKSHFALDFAFLLAYATFGFSLGTLLVNAFETETIFRTLLPWLLPLGACFDMGENVLHKRLVNAPISSQPKTLFAAAGVSASIKWVLLLAFIPAAALASFIDTT